MNFYLFGKQPMLSVEIRSQKSDAHNTFPCRLILTDTTTTLTANELKFITVIAPAFLIFIRSWRIQKHRQHLTPRSFLPRYFQSLSLFFFCGLDSRRDRNACSSSNASNFKSRERRHQRATKHSRSSRRNHRFCVEDIAEWITER